ncbi:hypothetical protein Egran_05389 [Elaphomyces granulatus]|uniref:non-specific serine/threonine protein kinase n=1 Tax=Elaphomyces granulatus TaxID=519963 RepID=A0A232LRY5_9EURO|nr:hypothetical protein Egran_05389 [Elaphomyces granulatus]
MSDIYYTNVIEAVEDIDNYRTGGFHSVRFGDKYKGKWIYKILLKLGYRRFSTVWLASVLNVDLTEYVVLKFVVSNLPNKGYEQRVLKWLSLTDPGPSHPGRQYVIHLIDSFTISGPNGQHDVVTDVVGPSFATVQSECYDIPIGVVGAFPLLPTARAARQLLMALDYLRRSSWSSCLDETLYTLTEEFYIYPDKREFAEFLRLILVIRPENRANIPMPLHQKWLQQSPGPLLSISS